MTSPSSTSISSAPPLGPVCLRIGFFLLPALLFFGAFEAIFWRTGECWPAPWVEQILVRDQRSLYGPRYFAPVIGEVNLHRLQSGRIEVLALGSSRVTQFRSIMFPSWETHFLNCGLLVTSAPQLADFGQRFLSGALPLPPILIVNIDPWWMSGAGVGSHSEEAARGFGGVEHVAAMRKALRQGDIPWSALRPDFPRRDPFFGYHAIGLGALRGNGYRSDGSVLRTDFLIEYSQHPHYRDREIPPVIDRIHNLSYQFVPIAGLNWSEADRIVSTLAALQAKGSEVYVFLPPFSTECDEALRASDRLSRWYAEYRGEFAARLESAGLVCANVATPATYGLSDDSMIDGFHPGEVFITHVVEELVRKAGPAKRLGQMPVDHLRRLREAPGATPLSLESPQSEE